MLEAILDTDHRIDEEMRKPSRQRNLITGAMGKQIRKQAKRQKLPVREIWTALFEALMQDVSSRLEGGLPADTSMMSAFWFYLMEREDSTDPDRMKCHLAGPAQWADLVEGKEGAKIWKEVKWLCDWIEADFALSTYCSRRMNKNTVKDDQFTRDATLAVTWALGDPEAGHDKSWKKEMGWLSGKYERKSPEKTAEVIKARNHVKKGNEPPVQRVDIWLFRIWPLVLHWRWNRGDIWRILKEIAPENTAKPFEHTDESTGGCVLFLNLGLRGGEERGGTGKRRVKESIPRTLVAKSLSTWI